LWFLGPARLTTSNGMSIGSADLAQLTAVTDRQTDRPRYSACNNRPHLHNNAVPNKNHSNKWSK